MPVYEKLKMSHSKLNLLNIIARLYVCGKYKISKWTINIKQLSKQLGHRV